MTNSLLHVGLQISRYDYDNFYCKVLGFVQDRSFELTNDNAMKIFQTEKGASVLVGYIPEFQLELFVCQDVLNNSFNHICFESDRINDIESKVRKSAYRKVFLEHSGTLFISDSCNNLFEIKPLK
jgi:hypothetical protein